MLHHQDSYVTLYHGDSLRILQELPTDSVDAVITDPPYSSGGMMRSDRNQKTSDKYTLSGTGLRRPEFLGDNRDQRSFLTWSSLWMSECLRICKSGGVLFCFTDWRQLPTMTDAIQVGGWVWRGIVPWDKTEGVRPQKGWFRAQCEYIVTASHGSLGMEKDRAAPCLEGFFRFNVNDGGIKEHITGKPPALMKRLLQVVPPGSVVLDPFAGGGTTLFAAKELNMQGIGIEIDRTYCDIIKNRLAQETLALFDQNTTNSSPPLRGGAGQSLVGL